MFSSKNLSFFLDPINVLIKESKFHFIIPRKCTSEIIGGAFSIHHPWGLVQGMGNHSTHWSYWIGGRLGRVPRVQYTVSALVINSL